MKSLISACVVALFLSACGCEPPAIEPTSAGGSDGVSGSVGDAASADEKSTSALATGSTFVGTGEFTGGYWCGPRWWPTIGTVTQKHHTQLFGLPYYTASISVGSAIAGSALISMYCPDIILPAIGNPLQPYASGQTYICTLYSKRAGETQWSFSSLVDVAYNAFSYTKAIPPYYNGFWSIYMVRDPFKDGTLDGLSGCGLNGESIPFNLW